MFSSIFVFRVFGNSQVSRSFSNNQAVVLAQRRRGGVDGLLGEVVAAVTDVDKPIRASAASYSDGLTGARMDYRTVSRRAVVPDKGQAKLLKMGVPLDSWPFESTKKKAHAASHNSVTIEDALHFFDDAPHANPLLSAQQRAKLMRQQAIRERCA